jgi:hypothetical protein
MLEGITAGLAFIVIGRHCYAPCIVIPFVVIGYAAGLMLPETYANIQNFIFLRQAWRRPVFV